jgi:integrase
MPSKLATTSYRGQPLGPGMYVRDGLYGHIEVRATWGTKRRVKRFPMDTPLSQMMQWQYEAREALRLGLAGGPKEPRTLRQDVDTYLASLTPERRARAHAWLRYWVEAYGHVRRVDLTADHVRRFYAQVRPHTGRAFSASSKNKLRTYLIAVWTFHDGRRHTCPARELPLLPEAYQTQRVREIPPDKVMAILDAMPDGPNRAALGVMFTTGCRPHELKALRPEAWHLEAQPPYVDVTTAKGGRDRRIHLPPLGVAFARDFLRHVAWRIRHNMGRDMLRAARRVGIPLTAPSTHPSGRARRLVCPYALRHSYAMNLRRAGAGIEDIADALGHKHLNTTRIYAQPLPERQAALVAKMWAGVGAPAP